MKRTSYISKSYVANSESTKNELRLKWRARSLAYAKNLIRLQKTVKTRVLKKGDVVYKEGEKGNAMFRVFDEGGGKARLSSKWSALSYCPSAHALSRGTRSVAWGEASP